MILSILFWLCSHSFALGNVVGGRHVYILYPGVDAIWGSYIFTVTNNGTVNERMSFPVMLPKETVDFQAQDTLQADEIQLGSDGGVTISKDFPPGETMLQVGFKLPAAQGQAIANFRAPYDFNSLGVFVWQDSFSVHGEGMEVQKGINLSGRNFDAYSFIEGKSGQTYTVSFQGLPEGRGRLWIVGWVAGALLLIAGFALAYYSRPKLTQLEEGF